RPCRPGNGAPSGDIDPPADRLGPNSTGLLLAGGCFSAKPARAGIRPERDRRSPRTIVPPAVSLTPVAYCKGVVTGRWGFRVGPPQRAMHCTLTGDAPH